MLHCNIIPKIINNNGEVVESKLFTNLWDHYKNPKIKEVNDIFINTPELSNIGTQEQYSQYLSTIFPNSTMNNIVYHGGNININSFDKSFLGSFTGATSAKEGFFFTDNINVADSYAKDVILREVGELKELVQEWEREVEKIERLYQTKKAEAHELYVKANSLVERILELINRLLGYEFIKNEQKWEAAISEMHEVYKKRRDLKYSKPKAKKQLGDPFWKNYESVVINNPNKAIYRVLLNIENQQTRDFIKDPSDSGRFYSDSIKEIKDGGFDAAILTNVVDAGINSHFTSEEYDSETGTWKKFIKPNVTYSDFYKGTDYIVFEPEQIHILGSKQDIEGFKKFTSKDKSTQPSNSLVDARNKAIDQYSISRSPDFIQSFGDWILLRNYKSNNLTSLQESNLNNIYNGDISILSEVLEGKLDSNGEPTIEHVLNHKPIEQEHKDLVNNASLESSYPEIRHINRIFSKYLIEHIEEGNKAVTKADIASRFESEMNDIWEQYSELSDKPVDKLTYKDINKINLLEEQLYMAEDIRDELTKNDSYFWDRFARYFESTYNISLTNQSANKKDMTVVEDETDNIRRSASWDDTFNISNNKKNSVSNLVKYAISTINSESKDSITGLSEPIELTDVWPTLILAHRYDRGNPEKILSTINNLGISYNPALLQLSEKLENDADLMAAYTAATSLAVHENRGMVIKHFRNQYEVDQLLNNRDTFPEYKLYSKWNNDIYRTYKSKLFDEFAKRSTTPENVKLHSNKDGLTTLVNRLNDVVGIAVSISAVDNFVLQSKQGIKGRRIRIFSLANNIIDDIITQKRNNVEEYNPDIKGDLLELAVIAAPYSNIRSNPSYFNVNRDMEYSFQDHSFITEFFSGLNTEQDILERFTPYIKDPKFQYSNWLWNTAPEGRDANGIFNYTDKNGTKEILVSNPVNLKFSKSLGLSLYGGNRDTTNNLGTSYDDMLNANWDLNVFVNFLFDTHFLSSSDAGRTFQLKYPKVSVDEITYVNEEKTNSVKFDNNGNLQSIVVGSNVYNKLANTMMQEVNEFLVARNEIFEIKDNKLVVKREYQNRPNEKNNKRHLLTAVKHVAKDESGNIATSPLLNESGVPTGRVFKFLNLSYVNEQGNTIYLHDFISNKGVNYLTLKQAEFKDHIANFIDVAVKSRVNEHIEHFNPIKSKALNVYKYFDSRNLSPDEIKTRRAENKLIKDDADFNKKVAEFFINDYITRVEADNFFIGNQNEYSSANDRNKRSAQIIKNIQRLQYLVRNDKNELVEQTYNSLVASDIMVGSKVIDSLKGVVRPDILNLYKGSITSTDGITVITQDEFIRRAKAAGRYYLYKDLIEDLNNENKPFDASKYSELIESLKYFMYSRELVNEPYARMQSFQDKNSTVVLLDRLVKDTQLGDLSDLMKKNDIDQVLFSSARKVGGGQLITLDSNGQFVSPDLSLVNKLKTNHSYKDLGIQVETKSHIMDQRIKLGVQISRLISNGLNMNEGIYSIDGSNLTGRQIFDNYQDIQSYNVEESAIELLDEWGAIDENRNIKKDDAGNIIVDETKIYHYLRENIYGDTQNENLIRSIQDDITKDRPNLPIYASVNYRKFVSVLFARIKNKVTDQKMPGIHANLVPELFLNPSNTITSKNKFEEYRQSGNIKFVDRIYDEIKSGKRKDFSLKTERTNEDGKTIIKAEVILNPWLSSMFRDGQVIDINDLSEEMRTMTGIRIPTEDKPSMAVIEVVGFMDTGSSQAIFPSDFITKTGWDFDIDSVYLYRKNLRKNKDGSYEVIKYTEDTNNLRNRYQTYIIEKANKIDDSNNIAEDVIDEAIFTSNMAHQDYLNRINKLESIKVTDLENILFSHIAEQDIPNIEKRFKQLAARLNKKNERNAGNRLIQYEEYILDELDFIEYQREEYAKGDRYNKLYEQKFEVYNHLLDVVTDLQDKYKNVSEVKSERFQEMQTIQRQVWENLKDSMVEEYVSQYKLESFAEFKEKPIVQQNSKRARQNRILEIYESILTNPEHFDALMRPNTFNNITEIGNEVNEIWNKSVDNLNSNIYSNESLLRNLSISSRELKGQSVSFDSLMAVLGITETVLNPEITVKHKIPISELPDKFKNKTDDQVKKMLEEYIVGEVQVEGGIAYIKDATLANNKQSNWTDIADLNIQEQTSETTANILDALKNLMGFNINSHTLSVFKLLSNQATTYMYNGKPNRFAFAYMFTHQPIVVDLVNMINSEEIFSTSPSIYYSVRNLRRSYLTRLYSNLRDGFINKLGEDNSLIQSFDKSIMKGRDIWIDHPKKKGGNYKAFYNVLNSILSEQKLNYVDTRTDHFHSVQELKDNINYHVNDAFEVDSETKYLVNQLEVLDMFNHYYSTGNDLVNLSAALKFDKADTPTFNHTTKMLQSLNNAILSTGDLIGTLQETSLAPETQERLISEYYQLVLPIDKIKFLDRITKDYNIVIPANKFITNTDRGYVNVIQAIFPSLFNDSSRSVYPMLESYYKNNVDLGLKALANLLLFETDAIGNEGHGWRSLKTKILLDNNLLGKDKVENIINDFIISYSVQNLEFFSKNKTGEETGNAVRAETARLLNTENNDTITTPINDISIEEFQKLSLANKLDLVLEDKQRMHTLLNGPHGNAHIFNLIEVNNRTSDFERDGYHSITYREGDVDLNMTSDSLFEMYNGKDLYLKDVAEDLIKYAFVINGLTFGNNISKLVPARLLYDVDAVEGIDANQSIGRYAEELRQAHSRIKQNVEVANDFQQSLHQSHWNNYHLNPIAYPRLYTNQKGELIHDTTKPIWKNDIEVEDGSHGVIIEPTMFVRGSEYANKDYVVKVDENGEKILYKRYRNYESEEQSVTFYYPIQRRLPFEFEDTVVKKYKDGILAEGEYINFIDSRYNQGDFVDDINTRISTARISNYGSSDTKRSGTVTFAFNNNIEKIRSGDKVITSRTYSIKNGIYEVENAEGEIVDFSVKLTSIGEATRKANTILVKKGTKTYEYELDTYAQKEGFENWADFEVNGHLKDFIKGKSSVNVYTVEPVIVKEETTEQKPEDIPPKKTTKKSFKPSKAKVLTPSKARFELPQNEGKYKIKSIHQLIHANINILANKAEEANDILKNPDLENDIENIELNISNPNLTRMYLATYKQVALYNHDNGRPAMLNEILSLEEGDLGQWEGLSEQHSNIINDALLTLKNRLRDQNKYHTDLTHSIENLDGSLSEVTKIISNESDVSVYIHDNSSEFTDRIIKSNMNNPVMIDIAGNINVEANKLKSINSGKNSVLFIAGDNYNSIRYNIEDVNRFVDRFLNLVRSNNNISYIKTIANDGIGNALYNTHQVPIRFFETTGRKEGLNLYKHPSVKYHTDISNHVDSAESERRKSFNERTILRKQADALQKSINNLYRLYTDQQKEKTEAITGLEETRQEIQEQQLQKTIAELDIVSFNLAMKHSTTTAIFARDRIKELVEELNKLEIEDLFVKGRNVEDRFNFVSKVQTAINISNSITFIQDLNTLEGLTEVENVDSEVIAEHDDSVRKLKEIDEEIEGLRNKLNTINKNYLWRLVMRWTRNPEFTNSDFYKARMNEKDKVATVDEIEQDLHTLFTENEDLSFVMMWADSMFDTGITLSDAVLKDYFQALSERDNRVNIVMDKVNSLIGEMLGLTGNEVWNTGNKEYADARVALLERVSNKYTGELLAAYEWGKFHSDMQKMFSEVSELMNDGNSIRQQAENGYDSNGNKLTEAQIDQYHRDADKLLQQASSLRNGWFNTNTVQDSDALLVSEEDQRKLNAIAETMTDAEFKRYLSNKHMRINKDTQEIEKVVPEEHYKSKKYERLSDKDRKFLDSYKTLISDIIADVYPNFIKSESFLPVAPKMDTAKVLKMLAGLKPITNQDYYIGVNDEIVYIMEAPMMKDLEKHRLIKLGQPHEGETEAEYSKRVVSAANKFLKRSGDNAFKSIKEINKYNEEQKLDNKKYTAENRSYDPYVILQQFSNQSYTHWQRRKFESTYKMLLGAISTNEFQTIKRAKGKDMVDTLRSHLEGEKKYATTIGKDTALYQRLKSWYDTLHKQDNVNTTFDQMLGVLKQYTSMVYMSLNVYGGIKNVSKGMHDMIMEAVSEEFIGKADLEWAIANYPYKKLLQNIGNDHVDDLTTAIIKRHHNMLELKNEKGVKYSDEERKLHRALMAHNAAYFANSFTEHFMQYTMFLAMSRSHRIVNGEFMNFNEYLGDIRYNVLADIITPEQLTNLNEQIERKKRSKEDLGSHQEVISGWMLFNLTDAQHKEFVRRNKEQSENAKKDFEKFETVYDQYELKDGRAVVKESSKIANEDIVNFERRVHKVNHQLHGIYNQIDKNRIKQSMIGDVLLQFRSWMRPNWNRYFGSRMGRSRFDEGLGVWQKGLYTSAFDFIAMPFKNRKMMTELKDSVTPVEAIKNLVSSYGKFLKNINYHYNSLPNFEKANIRRAVANFVQIMGISATMLLLGLLSKTEEEGDEEEIYALALAIYELNMIHSEITQFTPPGLAGLVSRTKQYVAPSEKVFLDTWKMNQALFSYPFQDEEARTYQSGVFRGRTKLDVAFQKNTPLIRQYHKAVNVPLFSAWYKMHNPYQK